MGEGVLLTTGDGFRRTGEGLRVLAGVVGLEAERERDRREVTGAGVGVLRPGEDLRLRFLGDGVLCGARPAERLRPRAGLGGISNFFRLITTAEKDQ